MSPVRWAATLAPGAGGGNAPGEAGWRANFEHDVLGTVRLVEAGLPHLEKSGNASILMISTTAALEKFIRAGAYNSMKAALLQYSGALSQDLGAKKIRVNAISAGPIKTLAAAGISNFRKMLDHVEKTAPLRRSISTEEVGNAAAFLCSPLASGITGEIMYVDAGYSNVAMGELGDH